MPSESDTASPPGTGPGGGVSVSSRVRPVARGRIVAIANQKGGVGKTTTCVNLAAALAEVGRKVLLVDMDPQGNATTGSGVDKNDVDLTIGDVLLGEAKAADAVITVETAGYDLLPANQDLIAAEVALMEGGHKEQRLSHALRPIRQNYHHVFIDCPPALNMLTVNALAAAQGVLIPMQCEYYALEGLSTLLDTIERIRRRANPGLHVEGLLRTMYDVRNNLATEVSSQLMTHFGDKVYRTVVPRNIRLAEAPSHGLPVTRYDRGSRGAVAYLGLAGEIIRREREAHQGVSVRQRSR